jgi:hypothetical protein
MSDVQTTGATAGQLRQEAADAVEDIRVEGAGVAEAAKDQMG